jgi:Cu(I)/Ag(I) efflux system membrane fusion protein/cobalt-zinc-cadmium efflux system membrane fusion protein
MKYIIMALLTACLLFSATLSETAAGLKAGDVDPKTGKVIKYWAAPMDPTYIRNEPGKSPMGMDLIPVYEEEDGEKLPQSTIKIDPITMQNMGVRTAPVQRMELKKSIRALGTVTYDETRIYAVNLKFDGWIEKLYVDFVGESVTKGQPLFDIYSPELVTAQEEYLLARAQAKSLKDSTYPSVRENAARLLGAARQRLQYWDLENTQIRQLDKNGEVRKNLTIYSPANGVVIKKDALAGHFVKAGMHQYEIADLSRVWVDVEVYEYELPFIKKGMPADMELSYLPGKRLQGTVLFIYPFLNPKTRTVKLRLAFDNQEGLLKPDMYANVYIESLIDPAALVIPQQAVIDSGLRKVVFVAQGAGKFEPRPVRLGLEGENSTFQVLEGLQEGDNIVTSAQFMFDSESRLREAIQKMLEARTSQSAELSADDLDMSDMSMDASDLDMSDMKMDN